MYYELRNYVRRCNSLHLSLDCNTKYLKLIFRKKIYHFEKNTYVEHKYYSPLSGLESVLFRFLDKHFNHSLALSLENSIHSMKISFLHENGQISSLFCERYIITLQSGLRNNFSPPLTCCVQRELEFKVDSERQMFEKLYVAICSQGFCQKSYFRFHVCPGV